MYICTYKHKVHLLFEKKIAYSMGGKLTVQLLHLDLHSHKYK